MVSLVCTNKCEYITLIGAGGTNILNVFEINLICSFIQCMPISRVQNTKILILLSGLSPGGRGQYKNCTKNDKFLIVGDSRANMKTSISNAPKYLGRNHELMLCRETLVI